MILYQNGKYLALKDVRVSPLDLGLLRAYAVFDFVRVYDGRIFLLKEHTKRLDSSLTSMNFATRISAEKINSIVQKLLKLNNTRDAYARIVVTGGESLDGFSINKKNENTIVMLHNVADFKRTKQDLAKGGKLITHEYQRPFHKFKTTNYVLPVVMSELKSKAGAIELLYTYSGNILECSSAGFVGVKNGTIIIPKEDILPSTRVLLLEKLAKKAKVPVIYRKLPVKELKSLDEAILSSTTRPVYPIVKVDKIKIGKGIPGPVTQRIMAEFEKYVKANTGKSNALTS